MWAVWKLQAGYGPIACDMFERLGLPICKKFSEFCWIGLSLVVEMWVTYMFSWSEVLSMQMVCIWWQICRRMWTTVPSPWKSWCEPISDMGGRIRRLSFSNWKTVRILRSTGNSYLQTLEGRSGVIKLGVWKVMISSGVWCCLICWFFLFRRVFCQDSRVCYLVRSFVEYRDGHFVAYVKQKQNVTWMKCDDSVVTCLEGGMSSIWPRLIFLEKMRRQPPLRAVESSSRVKFLSRLPELLESVVTGAGLCGWERRVSARVERSATESQTGVKIDAAIVRRAVKRLKKRRLEVRKNRKDTRGKRQPRKDRQDMRKPRKDREDMRRNRKATRGKRQQGKGSEDTRGKKPRQEERRGREDDRKRETRRRQEEVFGGKTWSNNMSGYRMDAENEEDHPFNRFQQSFPLRRKQEVAELREWLDDPGLEAVQPCLLCQEGFKHRTDLLVHIDAEHGGLQRYRNAVLCLESLSPHVVSGQEAQRSKIWPSDGLLVDEASNIKLLSCCAGETLRQQLCDLLAFWCYGLGTTFCGSNRNSRSVGILVAFSHGLRFLCPFILDRRADWGVSRWRPVLHAEARCSMEAYWCRSLPWEMAFNSSGGVSE